MARAGVSGPVIGLPPGVEIGPLGSRFLAYVIDRSVPAVVGGLASVLIVQLPNQRTLVAVLAAVIVVAWGLLVWQMYAVRAAGPGMRLLKLQLVGYTDGRPIGWGRFFLRWLVLALLGATGIGLLFMIIFLILHPRRQGWHDLAADSVVIKERALAPPKADEAPAAAIAPAEESAEAGPLAAEVPPMPAEPVPRQPAVLAPEQEATSERPVTVAAMEREPEPEVDHRGLEEGWQVVLDDGRELEVRGLVLLGRNPQPRAGEEDAQLIKVADETRTVSKSHLALGVDGNGMYVMDRGSTNGSTVTMQDGASHPCPPGDLVAVQPGAVVSFGDHWLEVRRP
jgi:uncharacterized RDD family membrane protein YckC